MSAGSRAANPYINRSIGEFVTEDSGTSEDDSASEQEESDSEEPADEESATEEPSAPEPSRAAGSALPRPPPSISRFIMIFLGLLAIYAIISPDVGIGFASYADKALAPAIGFGGAYPTLTILLAGILTTTISSVIRDHYTNWVKMARTQKVMASWRREQMEAMRKEGQTTKLAKLKEAQQGFLKDTMEMQTTPLKSMAWTLFLFIVIFTWLRLFVDVTLSNLGNQWIAVPWSDHVFLNSAYLFPSWVLLYSLLAIPFGQIVTRVLKYVRFRRRLEGLGGSLQIGPTETA